MTGEQIKEERLKRNWTQETMGLKMGVYAVQIGDWERGKHKPSRKSIWRLRALFSANPAPLKNQTWEVTGQNLVKALQDALAKKPKSEVKKLLKQFKL